MFALNIPLTGIFVGGFAVVAITLIAWFSKGSYKQVLQSTLLVLIVKAAVSPHAPLPAYLAVSFQGFMGAVLFYLISNYRLAAILLGLLAMAESALQKIIVLTLLFGRSLWDAVDALFKSIAKDFSLQNGFSWYVIVFYVILHAVWGILVGSWAAGLPAKIEKDREHILTEFASRNVQEMQVSPVHKSKWNKWVLFVLLLLFIVLMTVFDGQNVSSKIVYLLARTAMVILLLFFVLQPLFKWLIKKWLVKAKNKQHVEAMQLMNALPGLRAYVKPAWQMAAGRSGLKRLQQFVLNMLVLSIYGRHSNIYILTGPVQSGKTTRLLQFIQGKKAIGGILTPDISGKRKLLGISSGEYYDLQVDENFSGEKISIGKFHFDNAFMEKAIEILLQDRQDNPGWLIVDEVGKLEVEQGAGLHTAVLHLIDYYQSGAPGKLLLVVRDSLLEKAILKYGLQEAQVVNDLNSI